MEQPTLPSPQHHPPQTEAQFREVAVSALLSVLRAVMVMSEGTPALIMRLVGVMLAGAKYGADAATPEGMEHNRKLLATIKSQIELDVIAELAKNKGAIA